MIFDDAGSVLTYWPITGLTEGEESQHIFIRVDVPVMGLFSATDDPRLRVMGKLDGPGPFVDLATVGVDLSAMSPGQARMEIYCVAHSPIDLVERVGLTVGAASDAAAAYLL